MKIRRVTLENLNSLRGEQTVDFTAEPIASAGIFAITGPTGAGKSTLLDAITLALYGRAARYGKSPNPDDMMSRHCGSCRAEVEFEVPAGIFRAEWLLHRSRGKADGNVQPAKRSVYGPGGEVLTQKLKEADAKVEELCGLDYGRFMRSALLAQGDFARFLKADESERAELLESLTGTSIYSELSRSAHEESARRQTELTQHEQQLGLVQPLAEEERTEVEETAKGATAQLAKTRVSAKTLAGQISAGEQLLEQLATEKKLRERRAKLDADRTAHKPALEKLTAHRKTEPFAKELLSLEEAEKRSASLKQQTEEAQKQASAAAHDKSAALAAARVTGDAEISACQKKLDAARDTANRSEKLRADAEKWLKAHAADAALKEALPDLVAGLTGIDAKRKRLVELSKEIAALEKEQTETSKTLAAAGNLQKGAEAALTEAKSEQATLAKALDEFLDGRSEKQRRAELEQLHGLAGQAANLAKLREQAAGLQRQLDAQRAKLPATAKAAEAADSAHNAAAKLVESKRDHLADAKLIASLEQHRAELKAGDACPLCGSVEHPFCEGEQEKPTAPSVLEQQLVKATEELAIARKVLDAAKKESTELEATIKSLDTSTKTLSTDIEAGQREVAQAKQELLLGDEDDFAKLIAAKKAELEKIASATDAATQSEKAHIKATAKAEKAKAESESVSKAQADLDKRLAAAAKSLKNTRAEESSSGDTLAKALKGFDLTLPDAGGEADLRATLEARERDFGAHEKAFANASEALKTAQHEESSHKKDLAARRERVAKLDELLEGQEAVDPGEFAFDDLDQAAGAVAKLERSARTAAATADERSKQLAAAESAARSILETLTAHLEGTDFADVRQLAAARLNSGELAPIVAIEKAQQDEEQQIKGALTACQERLEKLRAADTVEGEELQALRNSLAELESQIEALGAKLAEAKETLKRDDETREKRKAASAELARERDELVVWQQLAGLIGSHDGKKFRVFAQGLSLDLLLRHANTHLARLTERYRLARRSGGELGLEIIDLHQASATRPMESLSGGESFLASLALALGLSDLAGRNVRIDSLFIDEGFGTLDAETLDVAISALESLRQEDKTIGVISHIDLLKERIGTRIVVERGAAGSSTIRVSAG